LTAIAICRAAILEALASGVVRFRARAGGFSGGWAEGEINPSWYAGRNEVVAFDALV